MLSAGRYMEWVIRFVIYFLFILYIYFSSVCVLFSNRSKILFWLYIVFMQNVIDL